MSFSLGFHVFKVLIFNSLLDKGTVYNGAGKHEGRKKEVHKYPLGFHL